MLIDAHAHLDKYGELLDRALTQIEKQQIFTVATAMDPPSYTEMQKIAARSEWVLATFGIHPRRAADYADRLPELGRYLETSPAIGEYANSEINRSAACTCGDSTHRPGCNSDPFTPCNNGSGSSG